MNTTSSTTNSSGGLGIFSNSIFQVLVGVLVLMVLVYVAYYFLSKLRESADNDSDLKDDLQKNFEEMRSEGDISEAEFRKIRASLSSNVPQRTRERG